MNQSNVVPINQEPKDKSQRPDAPRQWTIAQITETLSRTLPANLLDTRKQGGATITFIPWCKIPKVLDKYAPGWTWEIRQVNHSSDRVFIVGRLSIPCADGDVWREATGTECLKEIKTDKGTGEVIVKELAYGDPTSNAEAMALRRAAAKFGLGLYLYEK